LRGWRSVVAPEREGAGLVARLVTVLHGLADAHADGDEVRLDFCRERGRHKAGGVMEGWAALPIVRGDSSLIRVAGGAGKLPLCSGGRHWDATFAMDAPRVVTQGL